MSKCKEIKKIADLVKHLKADIQADWGVAWYRGQENESWNLISGFDRLKRPPTETSLVNKFRQNANFLMDKTPPSNDFEWLFLMQHYGVPTRLLDWSENPLVALYFAVTNSNKYDAALWVLSPSKLNAIVQEEYIPAFEEVDCLGSYTTDKYDKGKDRGILPIAAIATRNNARIQAQMGVFTISHKDKTPIDNIGDKSHVKKYIIPKDSKANIEEELMLLGISKFTIFPELSSIGEQIKGGLQ